MNMNKKIKIYPAPTRSPQYHAIDFAELKTLMSEEEQKAYTPSDEHSEGKQRRIALSVLAQAKGDHKSAQVTCPLCNSNRCFVSRGLGLWHCDQGGILQELRPLAQTKGGKIDSAYYRHARELRPKEHDYVPMMPSDFKPISPEKFPSSTPSTLTRPTRSRRGS